MKVMIKAIMIGGGLTALNPLLTSLPTTSKAVQALHSLSSYLLTPGVTLCLIFNHWSVHDVNYALMLFFNATFYSGMAFLVLWLRKRLSGTARDRGKLGSTHAGG